MWQEARKQEKKIRGMMVDHKKRAERRREYYEKIKQDPAQFLQAYGRPVKIHIDANIAAAADSPANMMPWQGQKDNMIDRFDGRAHLDIIPEYNSGTNNSNLSSAEKTAEKRELRALNYESYRILVQNDFLTIPEERFLRTIELEEQFGGKTYQATKAKDDKRKIKKEGKVGAAIGFNYDEENLTLGPGSEYSNGCTKNGNTINSGTKVEVESDIGLGIDKTEADSEDEDSELDLDLTVDIMALNPEQRIEINSKGKSYGLGKEDFIKNLARDIEEAAELKHAKEKEEEKAMFSGRKSRRERRIIREKQLAGRKLSPPSYAVSNSDDVKNKRLGTKTGESASSDSDSSKASSNSSYGSATRSGHNIKRKRRKMDQKKKNQSCKKRNKVEFITTFGGSGAESEGVDEHENEKEKLQAARREDARIKLKKLRRNDSPPPIIGPLLPPGIGSNSKEFVRKNEEDTLSSNLHKRRGNNYRDSNKRHSRSKSPLSTENKYRRKDDSYNRDYRKRSRSRSRGRRSRSPREIRGYNSRKHTSYRARSKSPRRRNISRRSRSRSRPRRSRSRSRNRETVRPREGRNKEIDELKGTDVNKSKTYSNKSRSSSPQKSCESTIQKDGLSLNKSDQQNKDAIKSSSDSSSSEEDGATKYRSKYRNKRRTSSSSEEETDMTSDQKSPGKSSENAQPLCKAISNNDYLLPKKNNCDDTTDSPLAKAKKMLAITTAKEKEEESKVELDASPNEQTNECDTKNESSKDLYSAKQYRISNSAYKPTQKSDQMIAPPPPSIRMRSPESPPLKRYYKRALRRAGGSSSEEISDEDNESKHDKGAVSHLYSGSNQLLDERSSTNMCGSSGHYASTSTSLSHVSANNTKASSNSVILDAKDKAAVKDKIKKRVQAAIKRQFKADQKAEEARKQRAEEERIYREEEMRDIAIKLRKREREKIGLVAAASTGDGIPPLMGDPEIQTWDDNQDYHLSSSNRNRSKSNERIDRSPRPRSRSRSPRIHSRRDRSKSPNERKCSSSHYESRDKRRESDMTKNKNRSRSKTPDDSRKSKKPKLKLVDY